MVEPLSATFHRDTELDDVQPTLIEGLPGFGLVSAIAVDQITTQLDLEQHGTITSDSFPPAITFEDGLVHDLVRVYAGADPAVMTLQSDLALPYEAFDPLSQCVINDLADEFDRAVFLAGSPVETEDDIGDVIGVGTTKEIRADLTAAGITVPDDPGIIGGITGALAKECYHASVPAAVLIVGSHPFLPDPKAASAVIETAVEPLVDFDIDTAELLEQSDEIQRQLQQIAEQYQQMSQEQLDTGQAPSPSMYQ